MSINTPLPYPYLVILFLQHFNIPLDSEPYVPIKRSFLIGAVVIASFGYRKEHDSSWVKKGCSTHWWWRKLTCWRGFLSSSKDFGQVRWSSNLCWWKVWCFGTTSGHAIRRDGLKNHQGWRRCQLHPHMLWSAITTTIILDFIIFNIISILISSRVFGYVLKTLTMIIVFLCISSFYLVIMNDFLDYMTFNEVLSF